MLQRLLETSEEPSPLPARSMPHSLAFPGIDTDLLERLWQSVVSMDKD